MMLVYYFRTTPAASAAIFEAKTKDFTGSQIVDAAAQAFASRFGGRPLFSHGLVPHFMGVHFPAGTRPKEPRLWSSPKQGDTRVAPKLHNVPPKFRAEAKRLGEEWDEHYPHEVAKVRHSFLLESMGLSVADLNGNAMSLFIHKGETWVAFTLPLDAEKFEEVRCSDFMKARAELQIEEERVAEAARNAVLKGMQAVVDDTTEANPNQETTA